MVQTLLTIFSLFLVEGLLSVDNAAVLALMVKGLPPRDQPKALRYGILGAFLFRGASLFFASLLIRIYFLKAVAAVYLLYLAYEHFSDEEEWNGSMPDTKELKMYRFGMRLGLNRLWATVILVEFMDMMFSFDNIFACVAITPNILLILIGVFMGIIAMRFVAQGFVTLMNRFPSLETSAFVVIGLLGIKLIVEATVEGIRHYRRVGFADVLNSRLFDYSFSGAMMLIFFIPILFKRKHRLHVV